MSPTFPTWTVIPWEYLVVHGAGRQWVTSDPDLDLDGRHVDEVFDFLAETDGNCLSFPRPQGREESLDRLHR